MCMKCGMDPAAVTEFFYKRHSQRLHATALSLLPPPIRSYAEDVTNETFLDFHKAVQQGNVKSLDNCHTVVSLPDVESSCRAYLICVLRRLCYRLIETTKRQNDILRCGEWRLNRLNVMEQPDAGLLNGEIAHELNEQLHRLSVNLREAIILHDVTGLSYQDIAEQLSIPVGTVRSRISRARGKLRKLLKDVVFPPVGRRQWGRER